MTAPTSAASQAAPRIQSPSAVSVGAAIDIGSNSVHLLVGLTGAGWLEPLRDTSELLGLGDVVDRDGAIPPADRARVVDVVRDYVNVAARSKSERTTLLGTEPLRRATNADELSAEIKAATGHELRVLGQREEALLTFVGVTRGQTPDGPLIVVDIGGGSTEATTFIPGRRPHVEDIPVGSARLTNDFVEHDPPIHDELDRLFRAAADATASLVRPAVDGADGLGPTRAVFVGGTATNVARMGRLTRSAMARDRRTLERLTVAEVVAKFNVKPRRARQLAAGVAIVELLLERFGLEGADVSDASLRDGAIIAAARYGDRWLESLDEMV